MGTASNRSTYFDTPERTDRDTRECQVERLAQAPTLQPLLEAIGSPAAFLNSDREILTCNAHFARLADMQVASLVGRRFGEALGCIHAFEPPGGCGTTEACAWCGTAQSLRQARLTHEAATAACRVTTLTGDASGAVDAEVTCTPLVVGGIDGVVFVVKDMSDRHERDVLERIFFHDVLNAASGLHGLLQSWRDLPPEELNTLVPTVTRLAEQLVDEIEAHRDLMAAERGTLPCRASTVAPPTLIDEMRALYGRHEVALGKGIELRVDRDAPTIETDLILLRRVLGNLLKNALEATPPGGIVRLGFSSDADGHRFTVHNRTAMTDATQRLVFQRAFSTKGAGRGLGTYSARLLAERYLGAKLTFESRPLVGTTFTLAWTRQRQEDAA